jgi:hypothetical protein
MGMDSSHANYNAIHIISGTNIYPAAQAANLAGIFLFLFSLSLHLNFISTCKLYALSNILHRAQSCKFDQSHKTLLQTPSFQHHYAVLWVFEYDLFYFQEVSWVLTLCFSKDQSLWLSRIKLPLHFPILREQMAPAHPCLLQCYSQ